MFRVLTVSREFGSGGGNLAQTIAGAFGWKLLDRTLVGEIAAAAQVDPDLARHHDERLDSWMHRISRLTFGRGAIEAVAQTATAEVFDCGTMAALARNLIEQAYETGNCVIVGRGAQCILQDKPDVYHVFVYAPMADKIRRVREQFGHGVNAEEMIRTKERQRAEFIRFHFGADWKDPHLYDAMFCSKVGEDVVARMVAGAMRGEAMSADTATATVETFR